MVTVVQNACLRLALSVRSMGVLRIAFMIVMLAAGIGSLAIAVIANDPASGSPVNPAAPVESGENVGDSDSDYWTPERMKDAVPYPMPAAE